MRKKFVINEHIDVILEDDGKTHVYIDGEQFIQCMRLMLTAPLEENAVEIKSIDDAVGKYGTVYEGKGFEPPVHNVYIDPVTEYFGHCSNIQAWVEHDYDTRLLHSNISFSLLKELANVGDKKATRVLNAEIETRLRDGSPVTRQIILESCGDVIRNPLLIVPLLDDRNLIFDAMYILARLTREGDPDARRIFDVEVPRRLQEGDSAIRKAILETCGNTISNPFLLVPLLDDGNLIREVFNVLSWFARKGNADVRQFLDSEIPRRLREGNSATRNAILETCVDLIHDITLLASLLDDEDPIYDKVIITLTRLADEGDPDANRILEGEIETRLRNGSTATKEAIFMMCGNMIRDPLLLVPLLDDGILIHKALYVLAHLARNGDTEACRILKFEIPQRLRDGNNFTRRAILTTCDDLICDPMLLVPLLDDGFLIRDALHILTRFSREGHMGIRRLLETEIPMRLREGSLAARKAILSTCVDLIHDTNLLKPLLDDNRLIFAALPVLARLARNGNMDARRIIETQILSGHRSFEKNSLRVILVTCGDLIHDPALLIPLLEDSRSIPRVRHVLNRLAREGNANARRFLDFKDTETNDRFNK